MEKLKNHASEQNVNELEKLKNNREKALNLIQLTQEYFGEHSNSRLAESQQPTNIPKTSKEKEVVENIPFKHSLSEVTTAGNMRKFGLLRSDVILQRIIFSALTRNKSS